MSDEPLDDKGRRERAEPRLDDDTQRRLDVTAQQRKDPRYVDVKATGVTQRRYILADDRPALLEAYQSARIPDHIQITQINSEAFTATDDQAEELFAYLAKWDAERKDLSEHDAGYGGGNPVLQRERHQVLIGNVPQAGSGRDVPIGHPSPKDEPRRSTLPAPVPPDTAEPRRR